MAVCSVTPFKSLSKYAVLFCLLFFGTQAKKQSRIEELKIKIAELELELEHETKSSVILPDFSQCDYAPIMSWHIHLSFHANGTVNSEIHPCILFSFDMFIVISCL